jgi:hypothetical protein
MEENLNKRSLWIISVLTLMVPTFVFLVWNQLLGLSLFLIGLFISIQSYRAYNRSKTADMLSKSAIQHQGHVTNSGRTILVPIVDGYGRDIDPQLAEQRLAEARAIAGPKDTVVGVRYIPKQELVKK